MSSRRPKRQLLPALGVAALVTSGLLVVTPAGAEVGTAAVTSWRKVWRANLQPLADKRYYTRAQSDSAFTSAAESAAGDAAATAAAVAAADARLAGYYTKAEVDAQRAAATPSAAAAAFAGGDQSVWIGSTADVVVRSVSLVPPADGTVIVNSFAQVEATAAGVTRCSISLTPGLDTEQYQVVNGATGDYSTAAGTRGFAVTGGDVLKANLVCDAHLGTAQVRDSALTAVFAPG